MMRVSGTDARYVDTNGEPVPDGNCVQVDHMVVDLNIRLRGMSNIHPANVRRLLQQKFEVVDIEVTDRTIVVR